ncbi:MAG: hypothetical protein U1E65_08685 [Myxococcota bacterium]
MSGVEGSLSEVRASLSSNLRAATAPVSITDPSFILGLEGDGPFTLSIVYQNPAFSLPVEGVIVGKASGCTVDMLDLGRISLNVGPCGISNECLQAQNDLALCNSTEGLRCDELRTQIDDCHAKLTTECQPLDMNAATCMQNMDPATCAQLQSEADACHARNDCSPLEANFISACLHVCEQQRSAELAQCSAMPGCPDKTLIAVPEIPMTPTCGPDPSAPAGGTR